MENSKRYTWWNTLPHSTSQGLDKPTSRAYDLLGMKNLRKILLLEFKTRTGKSAAPKVSAMGEEQFEFLKRFGRSIHAYVVFNMGKNVADHKMTPGLEKS